MVYGLLLAGAEMEPLVRRGQSWFPTNPTRLHFQIRLRRRIKQAAPVPATACPQGAPEGLPGAVWLGVRRVHGRPGRRSSPKDSGLGSRRNTAGKGRLEALSSSLEGTPSCTACMATHKGRTPLCSRPSNSPLPPSFQHLHVPVDDLSEGDLHGLPLLQPRLELLRRFPGGDGV